MGPLVLLCLGFSAGWPLAHGHCLKRQAFYPSYTILSSVCNHAHTLLYGVSWVTQL